MEWRFFGYKCRIAKTRKIAHR